MSRFESRKFLITFFLKFWLFYSFAARKYAFESIVMAFFLAPFQVSDLLIEVGDLSVPH